MPIRSFCLWFRHFPLALAVLTSAAFGSDYTGKVLTPDGKPVKGATVYDVELNRPASAYTGADLPTTRSDDDGVFHFPNKDSHGAEFIAVADGYGMSCEFNGRGPIQIRLWPRTDLTLTFLTAANKPAVNVRVSLQQIVMPIRMPEGVLQRVLWLPEGSGSPLSATTDAGGVCVMPGLPRGGRLTLGLDDPRYAKLSPDDSVQLSGSAQTRAQPIHLQLAASISGRVGYESTTRPAAGVVVLARWNDGDIEHAVTGADGSYVLKRLRAGEYNICLNLGGSMQESWTAAANVNLAVAAGETKTNANFTLIPGVVLSGKVLSADDSKPIGGVPLGIYDLAHPRNGGLVQSISTDANGSFSIRVPPGEQNVYIMSDTPANGFGRPINDEKDITIPAGGTASIEFRLPRTIMASVKGKVVDPDGKPVANASVYLFSEEPTLRFNRNAITTGADGTFQTPPVMRSARIEIRARFQDMATGKSIVVHGGTSDEIVVQLQKNALGAITGRAVDQQGKPLKDARIELLYPVGRYRFGDDVATTDEKGNYKVDSLWADMTYTVEADHDGYGFAQSSDNLRAGAGQSTSVPDLTLYKRDSTVAGVLLDRDSKPVSGQRIYVRGPRSGSSNLTTDPSGKFQCAVVSNDRLTIYYNFNTDRLKQQTAKAGDLNVVLHTVPPVAAPPPVAPAPAPVVVSASAAAPAPPAPAPVFDPGDAITWTGWFWAVILVLAGGVVTIIVNAIGAIRGRKQRA
ncbi:MAG: carboxypeptidase-like regulatory domain-containing protein [Tepidisphaeraceae bacterium]